MFPLRWALAALVTACLLAGCNDDDPKPDIPDPTSSVSSTTPTESSTSPTVSPSAALGPEETVRAWVDAWNAALHTGDTSKVRAYDAKSCRGCDELLAPVEDIVAAGGTFTGGDWEVDGLTVASTSDSAAKVDLGVDVAAGSTVASTGAEPSDYPATKHILKFTLVKDTGGWLFSVIEVLS